METEAERASQWAAIGSIASKSDQGRQRSELRDRFFERHGP